MDFKFYKKTLADLRVDTHWMHLVILALVVLNGFLCFLLANKDAIVTITPWTLQDKTQITENTSARSYKEAWALAIVELIGNIQPSTVNFVADRLKPLLSPRIYHEVLDAVYANAQMLADDRISLRFEPREVIYEKSTDKIFVYGYSFMRTGNSADKEERTARTYELRMEISNYAPVIAHIETYEGMPQTQDILAQEEKAKMRAIERERKKAEREGIRYRPRVEDTEGEKQ